jgi:predicted NBD/HSP70 family sugar kinase
MMDAQGEVRIGADFLTGDRRQLVSESEQLLLGQIFRHRGVTQGELTDFLPLSQQSISRMVQALEARGMIRRTGRQLSGQRGQPSAILALEPDFAFTLGVSIMADAVTVVLADFTGALRASDSPKVCDFSRPGLLRTLRHSIDRLVARADVDARRLFGIGIGISGFRVGPGARFNTPHSLEDLALIDLEQVVGEHLGLPAWVENDGKAATIGENMRGVGQRFSNFAYYYIATGVGGGIIVNGRLLLGSRGNAGEFVGILPIEAHPFPDLPFPDLAFPNLAFPNLERLRVHLDAAGVTLASVTELVERYDDQWPGIDAWIAEVTPSLSLMVSATAAILDTDAIVLGGRIPTRLAERLIPHIRFFDINRRSVPREHAVLLPAECPSDPTAAGAAMLPLVAHFFTV